MSTSGRGHGWERYRGWTPDHWERFPERVGTEGRSETETWSEAGAEGLAPARGSFALRTGETRAQVPGSGAPGDPRSGLAPGLEASRMAAEAAVRVPGPRLAARAVCALL